MLLDDKRLKLFIILSLTIVFIVGSSLIVTQEISNIENAISTKAGERASHIKEKMTLIRSFLSTMGNNMQDFIALQEKQGLPHPAIGLIKDYPEYNVSGIEDKFSKDPFSISGSFSAIGKKADLDVNKIQEISAAFYLSSTFLSAFTSIPELKWVYYISKQKFMYTVPFHSINMFRLEEKSYNKEYWLKATPKANPKRALLMTSVYEDGAGKGRIATFSLPIYVDDVFRGIIALDVSLEIFNSLIAMNTLLGDSFLVDENNIVLASDSILENGEILQRSADKYQDNIIYHDKEGHDYVSFNVINGEVNFIHRLNREIKYKAAFINSLREVLLLLSSVVMAYMIYYFRILIFRVGLLANTDPLTSLLNRRAMEKAVIPMLSLNTRYDQNMCFLLIDIDDFKKVNDTYGHTVGDEVLVSVTRVFESCLRSSDLISRHGGEEFLIALPQTDLESGYLLAERIRTSIENTRSGDQRVGVTLSLGCVEVRKEEDFDSVITRADDMLYKAKTSGRNQTVTDS